MKAVCYSPKKQTKLNTIATAKSPIKMKNFKQQQDDDLIITKWTDITPLDQDQISFAYSEELAKSTTRQPISLSSMHNLACDQLICIKGQTTSIFLYVDKFHGQIFVLKSHANHYVFMVQSWTKLLELYTFI